MTILTVQQFANRIGQAQMNRAADRDGNGAPDTGAIEAALLDAEAEVLGYVRVVTPAPIPHPAPEILMRLVAVVARYNLWRREVEDTHPVYIAYRDAVKELTRIAAGEIALPLPVSGINAASKGAVVGNMPVRHFTEAALAPMLP